MCAGVAPGKKLTGLHGRWEVIHANPVVVLDEKQRRKMV